MLGDTTKLSQLIFKEMMQAFGTDKSQFQQPSDVYRMNNELYIKGGNPEDIPTVPKEVKKEKPSKGADHHNPHAKPAHGHKPKPGKRPGHKKH